MAGLWFEEFEVGQVFDHPLRRTVTETDNLLISALTHNPAPLHLDAEYMKETEYGRILVNSCFTLGLMVGISVNDTTQGTAVANQAATSDANATLANANALQDIVVSELRPGRTGNEILAAARGKAEAAGILGTVYTHPLGFFGHAPGPTIEPGSRSQRSRRPEGLRLMGDGSTSVDRCHSSSR